MTQSRNFSRPTYELSFGCDNTAPQRIRTGRPMSKQAMREEAERLIRETMEKKALTIKQGQTRIEAVCGKCGAPNRVQAEKGATRVKYVCKQCGDKQVTL